MKWHLLFALLIFHPVGHFNPNNLYTDIPIGSEPTSEITPLLSQKFTYLGEGSQIYAFLSEDGQTVLKLFKGSHQPPFKFSRFLSRPFRNKERKLHSNQKWKQKFQDTCRRYKWALLDLKEETGLLYLHFEKTAVSMPVTLLDHHIYSLDLAKHPFILQKKALLAPFYFKQFPEKKEAATQALKDFFAHRLEKGYTDPRQSLSINYGFIEDQPVQIDVGKIEPFEGDAKGELQKIHSHIDKWTLGL